MSPIASYTVTARFVEQDRGGGWTDSEADLGWMEMVAYPPHHHHHHHLHNFLTFQFFLQLCCAIFLLW